MVYAKGGTSQFSGGKGNVVKMNVYQEISQIIKEADGILIGASNGLSIAEGYNILQMTHGFRKIWEISEKNTDCVVFYTDFQYQ